MFYRDRSIYVGDWKDQKREGEGLMVYSDGSKYEGGFKADMRHGIGDFVELGSLSPLKGIWENDVLIEISQRKCSFLISFFLSLSVISVCLI